MKNKLLLGMFLFAGAGVASAQTFQAIRGLQTNAEIKEAPADKYPAMSAKAAGQVVWHDNFDEVVYGIGLTNTGTSDWTIDNDGETLPTTGWSINNTNEGCFVIGNVFLAAGGNYAQVVNRTLSCSPSSNEPYGPVLAKTFRMTSPAIDVASLTGSANAIFSFEHDGLAHNDYHKVFISTDGTTWTEIYYTIDQYGVGSGGVRYGSNTVAGLVEIDITPYIMSDPTAVQFRFEQGQRFDASLGPWVGFTYGWSIDNVKISTKADYDVVVNSTYHHTEAYGYTQIPSNQIAPIEFQARVSNQGGMNLEGLKLALDISGAVTASAESAAPMTLTINNSDTLRAVFTPSVVGDYVVAQSILMDETDDVPANNTNLPNVRFAVTDFIYAVDEASLGTPITRFPEEGYSHAITNFKRFGISFDVFADQDLHGADIQLFGGSNPAQSTAVGTEVAVQLYQLSDPAFDHGSSFVAETDLHVVEASDLNTIITIPFLSPYTLEAGETYILVVTKEYASDNIAFAVSGTDRGDQSWAFGTRTDASDKWGGISDAIPVVRANFQPGAGIKDNKVAATEVSIFPNPATDKATVNFNTVNASDVSIQVVDVTGKVVETVSLNNVAAGANSTELNIAGFATGIYSVVVKTNDSSVTKKLVIK